VTAPPPRPKRAPRSSILRPLPPRRYRLEHYERSFGRTARIFARYVDQPAIRAIVDTPNSGSGRVGVVVSPWVSTAVPWYSIMLGVGLAGRGRPVTLIRDDSGFPDKHLDEQERALDRVLDRVGRFLPVVRLSHQPVASARPGDRDLVDRLTDQNVTWILRGAAPTEGERRVVQRIAHSLERALPMVHGVVAAGDFDLLVVPGGVYGTSGLFLHEGAARGCRVATFDTDRRIAQICVDGVAAQNADVPTAFSPLWDAGPQARAGAIAAARAEFADRTRGRDSYGFQVVPAGGDPAAHEPSVLIPLNVEWDTAALGRHMHFRSTAEWLVSTIGTVLSRSRLPVIVRQHPSERREGQRSRVDVAGLLAENFAGEPRCRFVAASDPVSSYDLLGAARLVLPYVSNIGIEAAALGRPVLVSGACYYADLGFVWSAGSTDEYFDLLRRGLEGHLPRLEDQSDRAWLCYYLNAVANRQTTDFTPHPDDFWVWCRTSPDQLFSDPEVTSILEAIDTGLPLSLLRHRRIQDPAGGVSA
jgi:Capsule polysaccharide biosynthesis protein